ncbi:MAG: hypothetical protein H7099_08290 [Gemmatimonadaceae bacterium]|nr:hypothetical protein [Gemmatimonadaceae bacterium]
MREDPAGTAWLVGVLLPFARDVLLTILVEGLVLVVALDPRHRVHTRIHAAWWLSACTLPVVQFVFPLLAAVGWSRWQWVTAAEVFAPAAECTLFARLIATRSDGMRHAMPRDMVTIVLANALSFGVGETLLLSGHR